VPSKTLEDYGDVPRETLVGLRAGKREVNKRLTDLGLNNLGGFVQDIGKNMSFNWITCCYL